MQQEVSDGEISDISEDSAGIEEELESFECQLEKEVSSDNGTRTKAGEVLESASGPTVRCLEPELEYRCQMCTKSFHELQHLGRHIETHNRWRFRCEQCGAYFKTKASLNIHQRRHRIERTHQCSVCEKRFATTSDLQAHSKVHEATAPRYPCGVCGKDFGRIYTLRDHMKVHAPDPEHRCERCERVFAKRRNLLLHERTHLVEDTLRTESVD
ncbi:myoneurin-like [Anopheles bellator]|uniref:myoneurin-like n=1 Tax=Anopheles bellator TaxID=139047 RepID=UPI0026479EF8|nr:myoneurin-like [Anopheles bellator]